jgi:transketolase
VAESFQGYEEILRDSGRENTRVVVLDAGLATSMKTSLFAEAFPERYLNLGIAEQNAVGVASGLARRGLIPLLHTFSNFIARRAHDQVALSVAWPSCNVKLIGGSCGLFDGRNGPSHMAIDDLAVMAALPGMMVVEPCDLRQTRFLLEKIVAHEGPAYLRLRRYGVPPSLLPETQLTNGTAIVEQSDLAVYTLVACGSMLGEALVASRMLADEGIRIDLLHVSILKPLDAEPIIFSARKTGMVATLENHVASGGFGDCIARHLGPLGVSHIRLSLPDEFIPAGDPAWQLSYCGLDAASLAERISHLLNGGVHV